MEQPEITVYGAPWCPDCRQSKQFLGEQRIRFNWVNIDDDEEGRNKVQELNDVKQIIPTIVFEDGSILVEPSNADLAAKLGINHKAKRAKAIERSLSASATVGPCLEFNSLPVVEMDEDRRIHAETDQPRSPTEALKKAFPGSIGPGTPLFSSSGPGSSRSVRPGESSPSICRSDCHPDFKGTDLIITSGMVF